MTISLAERLRVAFSYCAFEHNGSGAVGVVSIGRIITFPVVPCTEAELNDLRQAGIIHVTRDGRYTFAPWMHP